MKVKLSKEIQKVAPPSTGCDLTDTIGITVQVFDPPTDEEIMFEYIPDLWADEEKNILNENTFAKAFRDTNNLRYNNGLFYTRNGRKTEEVISKEIWESLDEVNFCRDVDRTVKKLLGATKLASTVAELKADSNIIPFANGDFYVNEWEFHLGEFAAVPYRLAVPLMMDIQPMPHFHKWLHDLFYDDDIQTIQEYLGYCLVASTRAQKALFLVGEGGTGKSRIGSVLEAIIGDAMISVYDYQEFLKDKFKLAEMENCLVLYDDDLDSAALDKSGIYKKLITNDLYITADRKYGQNFKFRPYSKLISCCNQMLSAAYDNTDGFYRRLLPVVVKPKSPDFVPDRNFDGKLRAEVRSIAQWSLMGLRRLIDNDWELHESERTKAYLGQKKSGGDHMPDFMEEAMSFEADTTVTSADLYNVYRLWCGKNSITPWKQKAVFTWLTDNGEKYNVRYSTHIPVSNGQRLRGYFGMKPKATWNLSNGKIPLL